MPATPTFASPLNSISTTLGATYVVGSGALTLAEDTGDAIVAALAAQGLPSVSASAPLRFACVRAEGYNFTTNQVAQADLVTIFEATGLSGDDLSGVTVVEGTTDQAFYVGDLLAVELTAGQVADIQEAIQTIAVATTPPTGILKGSSGAFAAASPTLDYVQLQGTPLAIVFNSDGSTTKTYTNGLVVTITPVSANVTTVAYGSPISKLKTITQNSDGSFTITVV